MGSGRVRLWGIARPQGQAGHAEHPPDARRRASRPAAASARTGPEVALCVHLRTWNAIDPENLERVFEAFYTTKSSGVGTGLSICRSIIEAHGGRLWADANEPRGAVFQFTLPSPKRLMNSLQPARQNAEPHEDTVLDARR